MMKKVIIFLMMFLMASSPVWGLGYKLGETQEEDFCQYDGQIVTYNGTRFVCRVIKKTFIQRNRGSILDRKLQNGSQNATKHNGTVSTRDYRRYENNGVIRSEKSGAGSQKVGLDVR